MFAIYAKNWFATSTHTGVAVLRIAGSISVASIVLPVIGGPTLAFGENTKRSVNGVTNVECRCRFTAR
jgi:hypothetical protein